MDSNLNLGTSWDTLDGELSNDVSNLVDTFTDLLLLLIRVLLGVIRVGISNLGAVRLWLWLWLGNLDVGSALNNLDKDITTSLWRLAVHDATDWSGGVGLDNLGENTAGLVTGDGKNTDGVGEVLQGGHSWVGSLLDVLGVVKLNQGSLESGTTSSELRWVDSGSAGGWSQDLGGLWEDAAEVVSDLWDVGGSSGEDDLVNVKDIETSLLDGGLNKAVEAVEDLAADGLKAETVDGGGEIGTLSKGLDGECRVGSDGQGLLASLSLSLQLGVWASVDSWIGGVPLDELLGEVVHQDLVEVASGEVVVMGGGKDGVDAAAGGNNGDVGASSSKVSNNDGLVSDDGIWATIVCEECGDWLSDQLEDLNTGVLGGLSKGSLLLIREVGWNGDNSGVDGLSGEVAGGGNKALEKTGGGLFNSDGGWLAFLLILDSEGDGVVDLLWVCGCVAVGWIYRGELLADEVSEVCDGVVLVADELCFGLVANVLLSINVRDDGWNLTI